MYIYIYMYVCMYVYIPLGETKMGFQVLMTVTISSTAVQNVTPCSFLHT
jgi:hypothetical protein